MPESLQLIVLCLTIVGTVMLFVKWQNGRLDKIFGILREDQQSRQKDYREIMDRLVEVHEEVAEIQKECARRGAVCPSINISNN